MASLNPMKTLLILICSILTCCKFNTCLAKSNNEVTMKQEATISAEPALLPFPPLFSPAPAETEALSPDIRPLFPTPASGTLAPPPADSSLPIIPSSPSPPNPDPLASPHPEFDISPTGSMPESSAFPLNLSVSLNLVLLVLISFAFW